MWESWCKVIVVVMVMFMFINMVMFVDVNGGEGCEGFNKCCMLYYTHIEDTCVWNSS